MPQFIVNYVYAVEKVSWFFGRLAMYGIFVMIGVLMWSSISKAFFLPSLWTLEVAQFLMVGYYMLGGGYSMQLKTHVRMDLLYGSWSPKRRGFADSITSFCLITYLALLLWGGYDSAAYSFKYNETSYSAWAPYMWPIKVVMVFGLVLMFLQTTATLIRDIAQSRGRTLEGKPFTAEDDQKESLV